MQTGNKKKFIGGFVLALTLLMAAAVGFSQGRPGAGEGRGKHGGFGRFGRNLNLSDAQKTQMQQIADRYKESTKNLRDQMRSLHRTSGATAGDGNFNEAAVRQAAQARANIEVELEVSRARMMSEMYAVLTPEQKAQLAQQRQQWQQKRQQKANQPEGNNPDEQ